MSLVTFVKQELSVEVPQGANLREVALAHNINLYPFPDSLLNCRGRGLCGTCRVQVDDHRALSERTIADEKKNGWEGRTYRLACQSQVLDDVSVVTSPRRVLGWMDHPTYAGMKKKGA